MELGWVTSSRLSSFICCVVRSVGTDHSWDVQPCGHVYCGKMNYNSTLWIGVHRCETAYWSNHTFVFKVSWVRPFIQNRARFVYEQRLRYAVYRKQHQ